MFPGLLSYKIASQAMMQCFIDGFQTNATSTVDEVKNSSNYVLV